MFDRLKSRGGLVAAAVAIVVAVTAGYFAQDALFRWAIKPPGKFQADTIPPAPDYAQPTAWALRPEIQPAGAWERPWGVDVFFVHPTTAYAGDRWNAAIDDRLALERLEQLILPNHAAPFQHAGPVYAPLYRQASLHSELKPGAGDTEKAFQLAYDDVLRAFDSYVANDNRGRGILLVGIGQGGLHAMRLLADRFQQEPLQERLAAAYIIDAAVPADFRAAGLAQQPVCVGHDDVHCIVVWRAVTSGDLGELVRFRKRAPIWTADGKIIALSGRPTVCVNPLLWSTSDDLGPSTDHRGAARAIGPGDPEIHPRSISARCQDGVLSVDRPALPDLRIAGWGARYKTPEFNLFYADIAFNASERARSAGVWLDEHARKPARPLPPAMSIGEAPIHRRNGAAEPVR